MHGKRLLVVLAEFTETGQLIDTLLDALERAARPFGLCFALPQEHCVAMEELVSGNPVKGMDIRKHLFFYAECEGLKGVEGILSDVHFFLSIRGPYRFSEHWDRGLQIRFRKLEGANSLLTAVVSGEGEAFSPQAYLPALTEEFTEEGIWIGRGMPLVCAAAPVRTLLLHPACIFGEISYLKNADLRRNYLSIGAYVAGYQPYALETPLFWPLWKQRHYLMACPDVDTLPPIYLERFEQFAGFSFVKREVSIRAALGLFSAEDAYVQRIPMGLALSQYFFGMFPGKKGHLPLMVTALVDLPDKLKPMNSYLIRLSYLKALNRLPLLLYAGGSQERTLRMRYPNTFSYPDNALLPRSLLSEGMLPRQLFARNKLLLLKRCMRSYTEFSHYAWVDADVLMHPICPHAMLDFSHLMDNSIHMATVGGVPDASLVVIPKRYVKLFAREAQALTELDVSTGCSFGEMSLYLRLMEKFPDLFTLHPMPHKGLLIFTSMNVQLISKEIQEELREVIPAERGTVYPKRAGGKPL